MTKLGKKRYKKKFQSIKSQICHGSKTRSNFLLVVENQRSKILHTCFGRVIKFTRST